MPETNGNVPSSVFFEERRQSENRHDALVVKVGDIGERVATLEGADRHLVTYRDIVLKFAPMLIAAVAAGAGIVIAASKWV